MIKETNPKWSKLIKPLRDLEIQQIVNNLSSELLVPYDKEFTFAERFGPINQLHLNFFRWISPSITGLVKFPNRYITNGNTNFIDQVVLTQRPTRIVCLTGDYSYYGYLASALKIQKVEININQLDSLRESDLFLISIPFSANGGNNDGQAVIDYCHSCNIPLAIDIAYDSLTLPYKVNILPRENLYVGFTFSKTFGIPYNRIGVCYTGTQLAGLDTMNSIGYVNLAGVHIVNSLITKFPRNYMYSKYHEQYKKICSRLDLTPTDCILFAYKNNERICVTEYYLED